MIVLEVFSTIELLQFYGPKLLMATICGALVGFEREIKNKHAGLKTNITICVGATLFSSTSFLIASLSNEHTDMVRVMAQIVSGIGFLGAGSIIKDGNAVTGLTTASIIWLMGAIGVIVGSGGYLIAVLITLGFVLMTLGVSQLEIILKRFTINKNVDSDNKQ